MSDFLSPKYKKKKKKNETKNLTKAKDFSMAF